jgi:hypothetical protein
VKPAVAFFLFFGFLSLFSNPADAQQPPGSAALSWEALARSAVGSWAEYTMSLKGRPATTMRYALVAKGSGALAIEIETQKPVALVMRMDFSPNGVAAWKLDRIRMKLGQGAVQDVPPPEGADRIIRKDGGFGQLLGTETIATAVGKFECKHYKQATMEGDGEVWISDKALPTGLVQTTVGALGATIQLSAVGKGATAKIK